MGTSPSPRPHKRHKQELIVPQADDEIFSGRLPLGEMGKTGRLEPDRGA